ncbi:unnamed protein product [Boreogadus saida]
MVENAGNLTTIRTTQVYQPTRQCRTRMEPPPSISSGTKPWQPPPRGTPPRALSFSGRRYYASRNRQFVTSAPTSRLTKLGPEDDVEAYLEVFEKTGELAGGQWQTGANPPADNVRRHGTHRRNSATDGSDLPLKGRDRLGRRDNHLDSTVAHGVISMIFGFPVLGTDPPGFPLFNE